VFLVVLGVVVLLCSARLSYQAFQQRNGSACTIVGEQMVTGRSQSDGGCDDSQKSPYRLEVGRLVQAGGV
jgi:hypothetical protein